MDHLDAENLKAVERYVLGDLTVSEVEEFERHFFDCPQCSEELRALTVFQENARAVFLAPEPAPIPARLTEPKSSASAWRGASPLYRSLGLAMAGLLVGIFAGYLAFHGADGAVSVSAYPLYAQARGEETVVSPPAGAKFYELYFDRTWEGGSTEVRGVLRDASGAERFSVPVRLGAAGEAVHVLVPSHQLAAGKYTLVLLSGETEQARFPFTLRFQ